MCPFCLSWPPILGGWDEWTCDACHEAMDEWWLVDSLCWYTDRHDEDTDQFSDYLHDDVYDDRFDYVFDGSTSIDYLETLFQPTSLTVDDCVLCGKDTLRDSCKCDPTSIDWFDVMSIMRRDNVPMSDIYDYDPENSLDCFLCEYHGTHNCIPLRNWFKFYHLDNGMYPTEKISFCRYYYPDSVVPTETVDVIFSLLKDKDILTKGR